MPEHPFNFKLHAVQRAKKRHHIILNDEDRSAILSMVVRNRCVKLYEKNDGDCVVATWYNKNWIPVVYNPRKRVIFTVLPKEILVEYKHFLENDPFYREIENLPPLEKSINFKSIKISESAAINLKRYFNQTMKGNNLTIKNGFLEGEKENLIKLANRIDFKASTTTPKTTEGKAFLDLAICLVETINSL